MLISDMSVIKIFSTYVTAMYKRITFAWRDVFLQDKTIQILVKMKKRSEVRKHWALAVVSRSQKIFTTPQTPFLGVRDGQNLISWRWSLPLPTNPVWWGSMHAISSYHGNSATPPAHQPQTGAITIHYTAV